MTFDISLLLKNAPGKASSRAKNQPTKKTIQIINPSRKKRMFKRQFPNWRNLTIQLLVSPNTYP
jgi:hypothetical protein